MQSMGKKVFFYAFISIIIVVFCKSPNWDPLLSPKNVKELLPVIAASKFGCCTFRDGWTINIRYQISVFILKGVCV